MANDDVLDRLERMMNGEDSDSRSDLEYMCESLAAELRASRARVADMRSDVALLEVWMDAMGCTREGLLKIFGKTVDAAMAGEGEA